VIPFARRPNAGGALLALALVAPAARSVAQETTAPARESLVRERLADVLRDLVERRGLPGASAAIVLPDGSLVAAAAGLASREERTPLTPSGRLLSGSVGKSYVAATAIELALAGRLDLDAPAVSRLDPAEAAWFARLPNGERVTPRQLLRHQSGMRRYELDPDFWKRLLAEPDRVWTPAQLLASELDAAPLFEPGAGWSYADTNYVALGVVLERVLGGSIVEHVTERFLAPHGLVDSVPSSSRSIPALVQGYAVSTRGLGVPERVLGEDGRFVFNPQFEWCGGGWANTPSDLARWAWIFYGGRAFEQEYLPLLCDTVEAKELGPSKRYGLGAIVTATELGDLVGHDGFMTGYLTSIGVFRERDVAVAFQTNTDDVQALGGPLHRILVELARCAQE